jgi:hypothetical protein
VVGGCDGHMKSRYVTKFMKSLVPVTWAIHSHMCRMGSNGSQECKSARTSFQMYATWQNDFTPNASSSQSLQGPSPIIWPPVSWPHLDIPSLLAVRFGEKGWLIVFLKSPMCIHTHIHIYVQNILACLSTMFLGYLFRRCFAIFVPIFWEFLYLFLRNCCPYCLGIFVPLVWEI